MEGAIAAQSTPGKQHGAAQRASREAAERRASDAETRARSLQQQLASSRSSALAAQASLQDELNTLKVRLL